MFRPILSIQRVCIVGEDSLFEEGIKNLLTLGTDLSISNVKYTDDSSLMKSINEAKPDVILLSESILPDHAHILEMLLSNQTLTAMFAIVIRLSSSVVDVYNMPKRFAITKSDELVAVVQGNFIET